MNEEEEEDVEDKATTGCFTFLKCWKGKQSGNSKSDTSHQQGTNRVYRDGFYVIESDSDVTSSESQIKYVDQVSYTSDLSFYGDDTSSESDVFEMGVKRHKASNGKPATWDRMVQTEKVIISTVLKPDLSQRRMKNFILSVNETHDHETSEDLGIELKDITPDDYDDTELYFDQQEDVENSLSQAAFRLGQMLLRGDLQGGKDSWRRHWTKEIRERDAETKARFPHGLRMSDMPVRNNLFNLPFKDSSRYGIRAQFGIARTRLVDSITRPLRNLFKKKDPVACSIMKGFDDEETKDHKDNP